MIKFQDSSGKTRFILKDEDTEPVSVDPDIIKTEETVCPQQSPMAPGSMTPPEE